MQRVQAAERRRREAAAAGGRRGTRTRAVAREREDNLHFLGVALLILNRLVLPRLLVFCRHAAPQFAAAPQTATTQRTAHEQRESRARQEHATPIPRQRALPHDIPELGHDFCLLDVGILLARACTHARRPGQASGISSRIVSRLAPTASRHRECSSTRAPARLHKHAGGGRREARAGGRLVSPLP